jgi:DNA-binding CsgD family transcriptional regulator
VTYHADARLPGLVGRQRELELLRSAFRAARSGRSSLVLVSGEPGIGKSRLIGHFGRELSQSGALVLSARCDEADPPYAPFILALRDLARSDPELLQSSLEESSSPELRRLLAVSSDGADAVLAPRVTLTGAEERARFFDAVVLLLLRLAEARPTLLALDDLHLADEPTVQLLRHLIVTVRHAPLLVIGAYRDTDLDPQHALEAVIIDLYRERLATRLAMRRLGLADMTDLIAGVLEVGSNEVDLLLTQAIQAEAEGVPFFAEELVLHLREEGLLRRGSSGWTLDDHARVMIPQSVRSVVGHRLSRLDPEALETLGVAAVIGTEFSFDLLRDVVRRRSGVADDRVQHDVEAALDRRLILERPERAQGERDAPYAFAHDQIRDVLYWNLSQIRRRLLHQAVAEAIEVAGGDRDPGQYATLAQHFGAGEDLTRAAHYSRLAGERAFELHAFEDAARHFTEAIDIIEARLDMAESEQSTLREYFELLSAREWSYDELGDRERQRADLRLMAQAVARLAGDAERFRVAMRLSRFDVLTGNLAVAREHARDARRLAEAGHELAWRIAALSRLAEAFAGRLMGEPSRLYGEPEALAVAARLYREALDLAEQADDAHWQAKLTQEIGVVDWALAAEGDLEGRASARVWLLDALDRWRLLNDARGEITALIALAYRRKYERDTAGSQLERGFVGFLEEIRRLRTEERHLIRESLKPRTQALALLSVHVHCREFGIYQIALERGLDALAWAGRARDPRVEFYCLGGLSETELELGRPPRSLEYAERAAAIASSGEANVPTHRAQKWLGLACGAVGDLDRAERHLRALLAASEARGLATEIAEALTTLSEFLSHRSSGPGDDEVLELAGRAVDLSDSLPGGIPWGVQALLVRSSVYLRRGDVPSAVAAATAASSRMQQREISLRRLKIAVPFARFQALEAAGHSEDARSELSTAANELSRVAGWISDQGLKRGYLEDVSLHRSIHEAAERHRVWLATDAASPNDGALPTPLTRRETEVLRLVAAGKTNRDIADVLFISEKTVARHLTNIFNKIDCQSRTQAAAYAYRQGIA